MQGTSAGNNSHEMAYAPVDRVYDKSDTDRVPDGVIFFESTGAKSYAAYMWMDYQDESERFADTGSMQSKTIPLVGRKKATRSSGIKAAMSNKKKTIVITLVVLLCCLPFIPASFESMSNQSTVITMDNPELVERTYADGLITVKEVDSGGGINYQFNYLGTDKSCTWYLYCNEDTAYIISGHSLVKRDYTVIGTGSSIVVSDKVMHVGSYLFKLVTENDVYPSNVSSDSNEILIDGKVTAEYTWPFIGTGGTSVMNNLRVAYDFSDYYVFAKNSDIGRSEYARIADYAVIDQSGVLEDLVGALGAEYIRHYYPPDSDWYANYLLSFVQQCVHYPQWKSEPDRYIYGQFDYFAYPLETLFRNTGDCEDTSLLLSAIYDCAGYDAAITLLYADSSAGKIIGHSSSAVSMTKVVSWYNVNQSDFVESLLVAEDGTAYYLCETTVSYQLAAGFIQSKYLEEIKSLGRNVNRLYPITVNDG